MDLNQKLNLIIMMLCDIGQKKHDFEYEQITEAIRTKNEWHILSKYRHLLDPLEEKTVEIQNEDYRFVERTLNTIREIRDIYESLTDHDLKILHARYPDYDYHVFLGFDGHTEPELYIQSEFILDTKKLYSEFDSKNSHFPTKNKYAEIMQAWSQAKDSEPINEVSLGLQKLITLRLLIEY